MKRGLIALLVVLVSFGGVLAQEIVSYHADIDVSGQVLVESVSISIRNNHETALRRLTYPFSGQVRGLKTFDESGGLESEVKVRGGKSYVTTILRDPLGLDENTTIRYEFEDPAAVSSFNGTYILSTSFPLLANVKTFELSLRLPEGSGVVDPDVDIVPAPTEITSDGRAVILRWMASNPSEFRVFVRYRMFAPSTPLPTPPDGGGAPLLEDPALQLSLSVLLLLIFAGLLAIRIRSRPRIEEKIEVLKEDEQLILKIVSEEEGIEQREIQRRTDFSKTKVSKILAELERRGAIRKEPMGKKNKIYLAEKLKE
ncbi:MAG: winged helix-turn-helix transcriptional regulator [Methanobacteriota archaeon]|nr:MAG: winged helix-turn-helix transcriptional regulator [Euryarchaeota archaeon]